MRVSTHCGHPLFIYSTRQLCLDLISHRNIRIERRNKSLVVALRHRNTLNAIVIEGDEVESLVILHNTYLVDIHNKGAMAAHHTRTRKALLNTSRAATQQVRDNLVVVLVVDLDIVILRLEIVERVDV